MTSDSMMISVPIKAFDFKNISAANLKLSYDTAVGVAVAVKQGEGLPGMYNINLTQHGIISIGWYTSPAATITDSTVIFRVEFKRVDNGDLLLTFNDDGHSCTFSDEQFKPLNDLPYSNYFHNGQVKFIEGQPLGINNRSASNIPIKAYPNPCQGRTIISFQTKHRGEATLSLYDLTGKRTKHLKHPVHPGENKVPLQLDDLPGNLFLVEVTVNDEWGVVKVLRVLGSGF
jgi:hypothetical protein